MVNPVYNAANLYLAIVSAMPVSVRNLLALVFTLCFFFFILHIFVKVMS